MEQRFLTEEERKCPKLIFGILDETIKQYGQALLDCGHLTEGKCMGLHKQEDGQYIALCCRCFDERGSDNKIINVTKQVEGNKEVTC